MVATILARRSIRGGFEDRAVPEPVIDEIVSCALASPSSKNAQPWRIHVVTSKAILIELAEAVQAGRNADRYVPIDPATGEPRPDWPSTVSESAYVLGHVPLALFIENCGIFSDGRDTVARAVDGIRERALVGYSFEMIGLGAAIENMWLAATALGLAGVFMGDVLIAERAIRSRLAMSGDLVGVLALAYSRAEAGERTMAPDRVVRHD